MKVCVLLMCVCGFFWRTEADSRTYLITAPLALRLDAVETVLLQLFGFTEEVRLHVSLKTSMAPDHRVLVREAVTLNARNQHQAPARVKLHLGQLDKSASHVILHVQSAEINQHLSIPVSRTNGFLFVQTDKPLYTPHQAVKVRAFSLNQELRPANRSVFLTFKDPDRTPVDIVEMIDVNNGIPSMQNPFKIPIKPKLGIWSIEAAYSDDFTTTARAEFEVKEYVLPSFYILVEPDTNYVSSGNFKRFNFKVSARYVHGAPVAEGEVFLRYGYVSGTNPPVIIPSSVSRVRLSPAGDLDVTVNMEEVFSKHDGPRDLDSLVGKYLYIAVLLQEDTGGITQEAEFAAVKFLKSPYRLSLVSTPPFIKPGLPYNIQVVVKDHLDRPVNRVKVRMVERQLFKKGGAVEDLPCHVSSVSQSDGIAVFICNTPQEGLRAVLKFQTEDPALPAASQALLVLTALAFHSPNQRYLYIDPPMPGRSLEAGRSCNIKVYSATPSYVPIRALSYLVLSKGKVVDFGSHKFVSSDVHTQVLNFQVTPAMVPSIRLLVYYILFGEGTSELVADSVWLDVKGKCVNGLKTDLSYRAGAYKPKQNLQLDIRTNQDGLVALSAVDSALFALKPNYRDPVSMVISHLEQSDLGCGGGGGQDSADVFRLAGLTFITNANAQPSAISAACTAAVRTRRALTEEQKVKKAESYGPVKACCEQGMRYIPKSMTCLQFSIQRFKRYPRCRQAFRACCEFVQQNLDHDLVLGRYELGAEFDVAPSLVRSYFPESWMWEVQRVSSGQTSFTRPLPDSLTTWDIRAVGVFNNGVCAADTAQVSVTLPLSVDVPLPYQLVRGEQLELSGSVYNQQLDTIQFCVTLTAGPAFCLPKSQPGAGGLHSTPCTWTDLPAGGVGKVAFTLLGLEHGEHTLTFTLKTKGGGTDVLQKKLRVVPEGVKKEESSGGMLDPLGLYGSKKRVVELSNKLPTNIVPNTAVERMITINGEVLGDFLSVLHSPQGLRQLINLPAGSGEVEAGGLLLRAQVYLYLESSRGWEALGGDIQKSSADLRRAIGEGLVSISSFRGREDSSYSMWVNREPSTWLTALVVRTLSLVDPVVPVDHQRLSESVSWLIRQQQQPDGSFRDPSSNKPNRIMAAGTPALDRSVYLTSFVLIALHRATSIKDPILQLRFHDDSMMSAVNYITQHAPGIKSVYVRAVATFALTLRDASSFTASELTISLEKLARDKGHPAELRYWQEASVQADWLKPDESSGLTVETTAYVLLTMLLKGRIPYANPILAWLTQDQHYGEGFYSVQDTVLTLESLTEYSRVIPRAVLNQDINVRYDRKGPLGRVQLTQSRPVATPIQVTKEDAITVSMGYGKGVSNVKLKTVYYETTPPAQNCNFHLTIEAVGPNNSTNAGMTAPHLVACAKYKPPPNELVTESSLTVMEIQLPTGVEAFLEDLRQFRDFEDPSISHFELQGNTVIIQADSVPSEDFLCVGFRIRTGFRVRGASKALFRVYEPQDKGSKCTIQFSYQEQKLQRLCVDDECQCMTAACAAYRGSTDPAMTADKRLAETCRPHITYAYRVTVKSSAAEGDFMSYTATVEEVLRKTQLEAVTSGSEVELVKKATCSLMDLKNNNQYLVMGASGSEVTLSRGFKYRLPMDSEALVDIWPTVCSSPECTDYVSQLEDFALDLQLDGCLNSS